jgi:glycyl-tRNA synthetase beta chain
MVDHADLLFELGTEELPPVALEKLSDALTREFMAGLDNVGLAYEKVTAYAAPRRLALLVEALETRQADREVQRRGPAVKAAFDADGNATKAAEGFARSCGVTVAELTREVTDKGEWLAYKVLETGKAASELLPAIAENALNKLPIPKRMRWGASEAQFVRPVHWLLFLHGDAVVDCTLLDAKAGRLTYGHRFHHSAAITIDQPNSYAQVLEETGKVIAHFATRREKIKAMVEQTASGLNGVAEMDTALLDEVTALNEWPTPIAGSFEAKFLDVPHEALVTTMKSNQKYFPVFDASGNLLNHFITIANIESKDPATIRAGNERVVRPRLADAMFFWQQDGKKRLEDHQESLKKVVFQKQLGSMYDKSTRVAELAADIAAQIDGDVELAHRAGLLSRCDLMTEMVGELASMQGIMGRYQAQRDGEPEELAQAMDEFYMPRFSGDQLPQSKTGIAIALAERLDTLVGIFGIGMKPTGDKDPFALRRAALGVLRILREHHLSLNLNSLLAKTQQQLANHLTEDNILLDVEAFMLERLRGLYNDENIAADVFAAVAAVKPDNLADFEQRIKAVTAFRVLPEAEALAAANKRIANLLKKVQGTIPEQVNDTLFSEQAERDLHQAINAMQQELAPLKAHANYDAMLKTLAGLRSHVDSFFDNVMVMADDETVRNNRLALLNKLSAMFLQVADISLLQPAVN